MVGLSWFSSKAYLTTRGWAWSLKHGWWLDLRQLPSKWESTPIRQQIPMAFLNWYYGLHVNWKLNLDNFYTCMVFLYLLPEIKSIIKPVYHILVGGFNHSEKYENQLGCWHSQYMGSHKSHVPVTTNQINRYSMYMFIAVLSVQSPAPARAPHGTTVGSPNHFPLQRTQSFLFKELLWCRNGRKRHHLFCLG